MLTPVQTPRQARHPRWRRLVERRELVRHPVSLTRQRLGNVLLGAMAAAFALYCFNTRDEAIRRRAIEFLTEATSGEVTVGRAQFRMFGGTTLYDVRVAVPYSRQLDPRAVDVESREIFSARSLKLIHNPWRLVFGGLRVDRIVATQPKITLVHNVANGMRNWHLLAGEGAARRAGKPGHRPYITLRSAQVVIVGLDQDGTVERRVEELDSDVRPHPQLDTAYCIEVRRFTEPAERTMVVFDPAARLVTNTPFVDYRTVRLQLPKATRQFLDEISLQGEVKLMRLIYDTDAPQERDSAIELRHVQCAIPLSLWWSGPREDVATDSPRTGADRTDSGSVVTMTGIQGRLTLRGGRLELDISGRVNDAECSVVGHLDLAGRGLDEMGLDLRLRGVDVPAPEGLLRHQLRTDPKVPRNLRKFFEDYDPHGTFELEFHVIRPAGRSAKLALAGTLRPQGAEATARWFPYPLDDVHGLVRFEGDQIYLEGLNGRHGSGLVNINGRIDRTTRHFSADVDITARGVPLDAALYQSLSLRYQSLWQRFNPGGTAQISVQLQRPGAAAHESPPKWRTHVTAELVDAQVSFREYPYPLDRVQGRLELEADRVEFYGLTGHHDDASVRIDGYAVLGEAGPPEVALRIEARDMRLDEAFAKALPPEGRGAFAQFRPDGFVDLLGTVSLHGPGQELVYDLQAEVRDAVLCYEQFPYVIQDVCGTVAVRPDRISIVQVTGHHGTAEIVVHGDVRRRPEGFLAELTFDCRQVALDDDLYRAVPGSLKQAWDLLQPQGSIQVRTGLHFEEQTGQRRLHHRTELEASDARICFRGFPLPLSSVAGRVLITDRRVEILSLRGQAGTGTVELNGDLEFGGAGRSGTFVLNAGNMTLDNDLIAAMPGRLRASLSSIKPTGRFDLRLDPLRFETDPAGKARWDCAGQLRLTAAGGDVGFSLHNVGGTVMGHGFVDEDGRVMIQARARLDHAELGRWQLDHLEARMTAEPGTRTIRIDDVSGDAYGGQTSGFAEVLLGEHRAEYRASITARDVHLDEYLRAGHKKPPEAGSPQKPPARGLLYGNTVLRGATGPGGYLEGAGELFIREAQVWKLPLVFAIFQVLNLTPDENVFHDGWVKFYLSRDTLTLQQIDLQGSAMSFIGGGRMDLRTGQLDVRLLAGSPVRIRVPFLTDLLEGASRELMEVQVQGTVERPTIRPQPLRSLSKALATLFPEAPARVRQRPISPPR